MSAQTMIMRRCLQCSGPAFCSFMDSSMSFGPIYMPWLSLRPQLFIGLRMA